MLKIQHPPAAKKPNDLLLISTRWLLAIFFGLLTFTLVMLGIAIVAVLTVQRGEVLADVAAHGLAPTTYWAIVAVLVVIAVMIYLTLRFVSELRSIVASVDEGDPFVAVNAQRLSRMAWLALSVQVLNTGVRAAAQVIHEDTEIEALNLEGLTTGLVLALTLFILARVFCLGTQMRDELEGTV